MKNFLERHKFKICYSSYNKHRHVSNPLTIYGPRQSVDVMEDLYLKKMVHIL